MKQYERVREIFNSCSGNQMRDVFIDEIETDDLDGAVQEYLVGEKVRWIKSENPSGGVVFDINTDGLVQRITFTAV